MNKSDLNDFVIDIFQDFNEIESMIKVLKGSVNNENSEILMADIGNTLEVIISKMTNTKISLDKYINIIF